MFKARYLYLKPQLKEQPEGEIRLLMRRGLAEGFFEAFCNSQDLSTDLAQDRL